MTFSQALIQVARNQRRAGKCSWWDVIRVRRALFWFSQDVQYGVYCEAMKQGMQAPAIPPGSGYEGWIEFLTLLFPLILEFIEKLLDIFND